MKNEQDSWFKDLDALTREAFRVAERFRGVEGRGLADRLRERIVCGGGRWICADASRDPQRELKLAEVRERFLEGRWVLYVARRCGCCDASAYRALTRRFDRVEQRLAQAAGGDLSAAG